MEQVTVNQQHEQSQLRVEIYSMLAHLLRKAPDENAINWLAELDVEDTQHQTNEMAAAWPLLKLAAQKANLIALEEEYQDLFIGIGRGDVVPFGSWYLTGSLMEMPLAHLRRDLAVLGFQRDESVKEPEDHIAALLEVMAMLVEEGQEHFQKTFFNRHIAPWFEKFFADVKAAESAVFYCAVGELALQFLTVEKTRFLEAK
ncbi:Putative formate dehydrogenase-specific chaperone [Photobacterium marinum]|uniref:Putative formate dehydrogenase-specific chaperone n=1 Tax=Photobacterium marinum TaxID=1056511 RepID=L8J7W5_9GAMM|nr:MULTISPECIES: molecular chaperone TorD family protein [Photobacterium]ELR63562.1 Putative formate dehydrogenase-specific chaperone [Photobacterium marinum]